MSARENHYRGNDYIFGNIWDNHIRGFEGDDVIEGLEGNDTLEGNEGHDVLIGGAGADILDGGDGADTVSYEQSDEGVHVDLNSGNGFGGDAEGDILIDVEYLIGSNHDDQLTGNSESNYISAGEGNDTLFGLEGNDVLHDFGDSDDYLSGGDGHDMIVVTGGNNTLVGGSGNDYIRGGEDLDTFLYAAGDGSDTIVNFDFAQDIIDLSSSIVSSDVLMGHLIIDGANVILDLSRIEGFGSDDKITFTNVDIEDFHIGIFATGMSENDIDQQEDLEEHSDDLFEDNDDIQTPDTDPIVIDDEIIMYIEAAPGLIAEDYDPCIIEIPYDPEIIMF